MADCYLCGTFTPEVNAIGVGFRHEHHSASMLAGGPVGRLAQSITRSACENMRGELPERTDLKVTFQLIRFD